MAGSKCRKETAKFIGKTLMGKVIPTRLEVPGPGHNVYATGATIVRSFYVVACVLLTRLDATGLAIVYGTQKLKQSTVRNACMIVSMSVCVLLVLVMARYVRACYCAKMAHKFRARFRLQFFVGICSAVMSLPQNFCISLFFVYCTIILYIFFLVLF